MLKLNNGLLVTSFIITLVAFTKRNDFPIHLQTSQQLQQEPIQLPTNQAPFSTTYNEEVFEIIPKYDYQLFGLVVSYRLHESESGMMLHALSKDHINVADYCVVWGQSADPKILREFKFSNGQFSCQYGTKNHVAWQSFNKSQLSNNHLLAIDEAVRDSIDEISIGDQIHIKGWLSHYKNPAGYERGTSTTRDDTGDGACETILVNEIEIIAHMENFWRQLMWLALGTFILTLFIYFKAPYEPHKHH